MEVSMLSPKFLTAEGVALDHVERRRKNVLGTKQIYATNLFSFPREKTSTDFLWKLGGKSDKEYGKRVETAGGIKD